MQDTTALTSNEAPAAASAALVKGARVGDYEVVRMLGEGAFGAVYEALKQPLGKRTALKVLHRQHAQRREVVERFVREAKVVASLEHPHIVHVFDVGAHDGVPFLAMEFLEGETLATRLARSPALSVTESVDLMLGVLSAVAAAHDRGVIHRDLKPDNIFLATMPAGPPQPRLLDFGIAKVFEGGLTLTRTNAMLGTPLYMSPEQAQESKNITGASDQWSLGVILYQCVTGARPFEGRNLLSLLNAITHEQPTPPDQRAQGLSPVLSRVILRALAKTPEQRFPSVRALGAALLPYASESVRAHWHPYFGAHEDDTIGLRVTIPSEERIAPPPAPAAEPLANTFAPTTHPSLITPPARWRLAVGAAIIVSAVAFLGLRAARTTPPTVSASPLSATARPPSVHRSGLPTPVPRVEAPATTQTATAPDTTTPPLAAPVAVTAPAPAADSSTVRHGDARHPTPPRRPHTSPAHTAVTTPAPAPAPTAPAATTAAPRVECPNGICPVD